MTVYLDGPYMLAHVGENSQPGTPNTTCQDELEARPLSTSFQKDPNKVPPNLANPPQPSTSLSSLRIA